LLQYGYRPNPPPTRRTRRASDQDWVDYDPIVERPPIRWPNGARLALWICPAILDYEFVPPHDPWLNPWTRMPAPDVLGYSRQELGNRVGFWRVLELCDRHNIRPTALVNVTALRLYPDITDAIRERSWDILGHGMCNTRFLYHYDEAQELAYYREMLDAVEELTGVRMKGMGGPGPQSGTESTPDLMAEAGFVYSGDWYMDDQPFPLRVRKGRLIAMPYSVEMNDVSALATAEGDEFLENLKRQFDCLYAEGAESGRVMCVSLHPHLIGQPQRIAYLERALEYFNSFAQVWHAHGAEIADYYMQHYYDDAVRRMAAKCEPRR
jgi:peptidoglycan/xylan/chitin deacetylase (PgdA/CDA1 family)